jgi:hypothetical protein
VERRIDQYSEKEMCLDESMPRRVNKWMERRMKIDWLLHP